MRSVSVSLIKSKKEEVFMPDDIIIAVHDYKTINLEIVKRII